MLNETKLLWNTDADSLTPEEATEDVIRSPEKKTFIEVVLY
jgi:hypothetical protein